MRNLSLDAQTQLEAASTRPIFLVSCGFVNETVYLWSGVGTLSWNGQNWQGVGTLGTISAIAETSDTQAQGITLTLSGIPSNLLTDALSNMSPSKTATIYLGFLTATGTLVNAPIPVYRGLMDQPEINLATETSSITIAVENRLSDLQRARGGRYTEQDQRARHPNDGGLKYVSWLTDQFLNWKG